MKILDKFRQTMWPIDYFVNEMAEVTCFLLYIRRRDTSQHNVNYYYVFIFIIKCDKSLKIA